MHLLEFIDFSSIFLLCGVAHRRETRTLCCVYFHLFHCLRSLSASGLTLLEDMRDPAVLRTFFTGSHWRRFYLRSTMFSALEVLNKNALYKSSLTFTLTLLLVTYIIQKSAVYHTANGNP